MRIARVKIKNDNDKTRRLWKRQKFGVFLKDMSLTRISQLRQRLCSKKIEDKRADSWKEYCDMMKGKDSYVVDMYGNVRTTNFSEAPVVGEFEDKEDAVTFAAFSRLIKLRKNWVGDWQPDWESDKQKFIIVNNRNNIEDSIAYYVNSPMTFPTAAMRDEFIDTFKDLLEIAKPLL